ncbi:MAG: RNA polymerase sigma factor SigM [Actinobacteria bacterium HGW-Actinobacteria-7]|jgi:RNA polymerase sigma-70 factor (ECF subfamily)|nr:MAG: RNA polymerase sigma factor SigM [Actinobacteria bacterium HGW-Actinobacteria-7]
MNYETADDPALVTVARAGDIAGFEALVRRHTRVVYAHALRFFGDSQMAEDVTQEVFIKVFRSLSSFDERARFTTWLYRITRNTCLDEVRAGRRRPVPVDPLDHDFAGEDLADSAALSATVELAMRALPPEDRDALSAVSVFGLTYIEAAAALGVPAGTVKSRVFRARRTLASALGMSGRGA